MKEAIEDKQAAKEAQEVSTRTMRQAARGLSTRGLSLRDIGVLLGVSFQHVQKLVGLTISPPPLSRWRYEKTPVGMCFASEVTWSVMWCLMVARRVKVPRVLFRLSRWENLEHAEEI